MPNVNRCPLCNGNKQYIPQHNLDMYFHFHRTSALNESLHHNSHYIYSKDPMKTKKLVMDMDCSHYRIWKKKVHCSKNTHFSTLREKMVVNARLQVAFGWNSCRHRKLAEGWHNRLATFLFMAENCALCTERGVVNQAELTKLAEVND